MNLLLILAGVFIVRSAIDGLEPSLPDALDSAAVCKRITTLERIGHGIIGLYILIQGVVPAARHW